MDSAVPSWVGDETRRDKWLQCARASKATYLDEVEQLVDGSDVSLSLVKDKVTSAGLTLGAVIKTDLQLRQRWRTTPKRQALAGYVAFSSDNDVVIAWRGTVLAEEWDADVHVDLVNWEDLWVHEGFHDIYTSARFSPSPPSSTTTTEENELKGPVKAIIEPLIAINPRCIFITGHSLGGALATLCAYEIARDERLGDRIKLVTFSAPRVVQVRHAHKINATVKDYVRIWTDGDIIPITPLYMGKAKDATRNADEEMKRGLRANWLQLLMRLLNFKQEPVAVYHHAGVGIALTPTALPQPPEEGWGIWEHHDLNAIIALIEGSQQDSDGLLPNPPSDEVTGQVFEGMDDEG